MNATNTEIRALIADDEPLARRALQSLLAEISWVSCIGTAADGPRAIAMIRELLPDLIFLDVRMPGASGVEVLRLAEVEAPVIFTTAYDDYAIAAFELGAIDYLLKPFGRDRLLRSLERARPQLDAMRARTFFDGGAGLRERLAFAENIGHPLDRIFVRHGGRVLPITVKNVSRFEADGDYVAIHAGDRRYLVYLRLGELAERLDPRLFVRTHRSHIVNLDFAAAFVPHDRNRVEVRMRDGSLVPASRTGTRLLRARMRV